ncbi:inheritance of peroxisomes protein 1-domain-containing protein [Podospora conica]|nr:inheritance of peroxisomes protein 1-domain-containing protein [Schizothecium conicum]
MEPSTPQGPANAGQRRVVYTAPAYAIKQQQQAAASSPASDVTVDTLYEHPSVKIVAFSAGSGTSIGPRADLRDTELGTLSWSSQLERTIAVGPFRIYRAPGSVAFLSCGTALQPILRKSQVWCVDEESSKFILQIRRPQFWRIEVPVEKPEDQQRAEQLREIFDKILQFEKTECPFKRSFTVELPEAQTPVTKRPWAPVLGSGEDDAPEEEADMVNRTGRVWARGESGAPEDEANMVNRSGRVWTRGTTGTPEPVEGQNRTVPESPADSQDDSFHSPQSYHEPPPVFNTTSFQESTPFHKSSPLPPSPPISHPASPRASPTDHDSRPGSRHGSSDVTVLSFAPPALAKPTEDAAALSSVSDDDEEDCESTDNTPAPDAPAPVNEPKAATAPATPIDTTPFPALPSSTALVSTSTAKRPKIRHRATTSSSISPDRRPLSPLPPAAKLLTPRPKVTGNTNANKSTLAAVRRLPMTVITKTFEILMSPPSHLIHLMLKVAARILAGEWRGLVFGIDDYGEQIPVQWDWSDDEDVVASSRCFIDDDWAPRTGYKMAGTFPESDEDDEENAGPGQGGAKLGETSSAAGTPTSKPLGRRGEAAVESEWSRRLGVD